MVRERARTFHISWKLLSAVNVSNGWEYKASDGHMHAMLNNWFICVVAFVPISHHTTAADVYFVLAHNHFYLWLRSVIIPWCVFANWLIIACDSFAQWETAFCNFIRLHRRNYNQTSAQFSRMHFSHRDGTKWIWILILAVMENKFSCSNQLASKHVRIVCCD